MWLAQAWSFITNAHAAQHVHGICMYAWHATPDLQCILFYDKHGVWRGCATHPTHPALWDSCVAFATTLSAVGVGVLGGLEGDNSYLLMLPGNQPEPDPTQCAVGQRLWCVVSGVRGGCMSCAWCWRCMIGGLASCCEVRHAVDVCCLLCLPVVWCVCLLFCQCQACLAMGCDKLQQAIRPQTCTPNMSNLTLPQHVNNQPDSVFNSRGGTHIRTQPNITQRRKPPNQVCNCY